MPVPLEQFVKHLEDSGILAGDTLQDFVPPKAFPKDAEELVRVLAGRRAGRKLTPQIEAYVRARWPDLSRAGTYGIGKRLRQESSRSSQWSFARKRCVPLLGELKLQAVPATRARLEESESVPTTTADGLPHSWQNLPGNQRVSSESEESDCDCWPQDAGQPPGPSTFRRFQLQEGPQWCSRSQRN